MTKRSTSADFVTAFATGWPENQLMAGQCDVGAPELARSRDHDGLPVAARRQGKVCRETGRVGDNLKIAVASASLEGAVDAAAALAPRTGERIALRDHIA